jgi:hypothetical protein
MRTVAGSKRAMAALAHPHPHRRLWKKSYIYEETSIGKHRLIIGTLNNPSLQKMFVQKKPPRQLLKKMKFSTTPTNNNYRR